MPRTTGGTESPALQKRTGTRAVRLPGNFRNRADGFSSLAQLLSPSAAAGGIDELRSDIQRLMDLEATRQLKYAYFRCVERPRLSAQYLAAHGTDAQF